MSKSNGHYGQHLSHDDQSRSAGRRRQARRRVGVVGAAAMLSGLLLVPAPGSADPGKPGPGHASGRNPSPTISEVKSQLETLNHQAEVAAEAYNTVRVHIHQATARMTGLQADLDRERSRVVALRSQIVGAALSDYSSSGGLSTSSSFLLAKKPREFIDALAVTAVVERRQAGLLTEFRQQQNELGVQERQAERELAAIKADRTLLATHKADVETRLADARHLLGELKAKARQRLLAQQREEAAAAARAAAAAAAAPAAATAPATGTTGTTTGTTGTSTPTSRAADRPPAYSSAPASGRAGVAVATALAQVGKPYVWGTAGPSTFDCSGLTMYAWAAAGVSLSHASSVQSQEGVPVSLSDLRPGDLVFYYSPVSHVAMYIGNGQVVHAPHTGSVVQIVPLTSMPISWVRRVG